MVLEPNLSVVVPTYGSRGHLAQLVRDVLREGDSLGLKTEIIVVDDASGTDVALNSLVDVGPNFIVRVVSTFRNVGQIEATLIGLSLARGEMVATMDDDGAHSAADLKNLLESYHPLDAPAVFGVYNNRKRGALRKLGTLVYSLGQPVSRGAARPHSSFRLLSASVSNSLARLSSERLHVSKWLNHNFPSQSVLLENDTRAPEQKSTYSHGRLLKLFLANQRWVSRPLISVASWLSGVLLLGSGVFTISLLLDAASGVESAPGFRALFAAVVVFGSFSLLLLLGLLRQTNSVLDRLDSHGVRRPFLEHTAPESWRAVES